MPAKGGRNAVLTKTPKIGGRHLKRNPHCSACRAGVRRRFSNSLCSRLPDWPRPISDPVSNSPGATNMCRIATLLYYYYCSWPTTSTPPLSFDCFDGASQLEKYDFGAITPCSREITIKRMHRPHRGHKQRRTFWAGTPPETSGRRHRCDGRSRPLRASPYDMQRERGPLTIERCKANLAFAANEGRRHYTNAGTFGCSAQQIVGVRDAENLIRPVWARAFPYLHALGGICQFSLVQHHLLSQLLYCPEHHGFVCLCLL